MTVTEPVKIYKLPQSKYIDNVRWLPPLSAFDCLYALAVFDSDTNTPSLEIHSITKPNPQKPELHSTWLSPSRISSLRVSNSLIAAATYGGSLHFLVPDSAEGLVESGRENELHTGGIASVDLMEGECVSVGEDGRVNVVRVRDGLELTGVFDSHGLAAYSAVKWASPTEFVTGGYGFGLQWWDQRKPGGPVFKFKANWVHGANSGIVHSVDIHPSRKHTCLAGGSAGTIFAWDLRWPQQHIFLSGVGMNESTTHSPCESEVWEIQYDVYMQSSNIKASSAWILPVMSCSEDGILAVVEQGEEPIELLAEPCAINGFDIDKQNPSDVICSLEWESVAILTRP
ncbi:hypothetical protein RJ641_027712 [Dillenia turbinata]|uniref:Nuclear pore complex protein NUP43 n=1 Tax=Dillenia turbinata TaxID=194707 RepID=A0AAN8VXS4_9MAGN